MIGRHFGGLLLLIIGYHFSGFIIFSVYLIHISVSLLRFCFEDPVSL